MNSDQSNRDYFIRKTGKLTCMEHILTGKWFAESIPVIYSCSETHTILFL